MTSAIGVVLPVAFWTGAVVLFALGRRGVALILALLWCGGAVAAPRLGLAWIALQGLLAVAAVLAVRLELN